MDSLFKFGCAMLLASSCLQADPRVLNAPNGLSDVQTWREARGYSFLIRDHGPDRHEIKELREDPSELPDLVTDWLASDDHRVRMERYFDDMMGFRDQLNVLNPNARLAKNSDGVYFSPKKGNCAQAEAVSVEAWWLPEGERVSVCRNLVATDGVIPTGNKPIVCTKPGPKGFLNPRCGCGPGLISCIAAEEANRLQQEVQKEFSQRAWQVYEKNGSWVDLLAAPQFYGTRRLYWLYVQTQSIFNAPSTSGDTLETLRDIPMDELVNLPFPAGAERSGIATAPGFLVQFNNFRSRIAGLTHSFLCQDMNPTLNTDGITTFVNPSLKPTDLAHGAKADCSSCHYALDNLGGAVMPWNDRGLYQPKISAEAHAFGQRGQGPEFLMQSFVERGPGFDDCMARRAWEDFSGQSWSQTPEPIQSKVRQWAVSGPRTLIQTLILSTELKTALAQGFEPPSPDLDAEAWAVMQPIAQRSCSGSSCHSVGTRQPAYAEVSNLWINDREKIKDRLQRTGTGQMPPQGRTLSLEDRQTLLRKMM
ncbi:MAG TPA: hypothetical protein VE954_06245 [Oligoflexus sp.]|uniref:hypothetical protein n=1 Tax=Oligoflexus sp. TaxID=1971216 RepID=UPI002D225149|nr:hypothetical protein [Oligoflexus sp.]HYX32695.1 hypothetical protein [Oligoflexus sp.]